MSANLRIMAELTKLTICAHDDAETRVEYFLSDKKWCVVNKRGLYITHNNIHRALSDLYCITGIEADKWSAIEG